MKLTIEIETDNGAFSEEEGGVVAEVRRILNRACDRLDNGRIELKDQMRLMDYNGNVVGTLVFTE